MEFILREFRPDDFEALWRIDQQCFAAGIAYSQPELAAYMRMRGSFTVVAEARENPATRLGFVVAVARRGGVGHVITIDVLPEARRLRVGSSLLRDAELRLQAAGCSVVQLETAVNNGSALAFYKRHGYFVLKTIARYYPDGVDAFELKKNLHSAVSAK